MNGLSNLSIRLRLILTVLLPILSLLAVLSYLLWAQARERRVAVQMKQVAEISVFIGNVIHELQKERGMSAAFVSSRGAKFAEELRRQRIQTDQQIQILVQSREEVDLDKMETDFRSRIQESDAQLNGLKGLRDAVDQFGLTPAEVVKNYTRMIESGLAVADTATTLPGAGETTFLSSSYVFLMQGKENCGRERAILSSVLTQDAFTPELLQMFFKVKASQENYFHEFRMRAPKSFVEQFDQKLQQPECKRVTEIEQKVMAQYADGKFGIDPQEFFAQISTKINYLKEVEDGLSNALIHRVIEQEKTTTFWIKAWSLLTAILVLLVGSVVFVMERSIDQTIRKIISSVSGIADEVREAATNVSGATSSLASGSSEQAAAVEETSASLEEISSMIRTTSDRVAETGKIAEEARQLAVSGKQEMQTMQASMEAIKKAGHGISSVLKNIDEIAFQTNLLALNAAVEAARAGEAGAGFSVVANEVRNLAARCASAAKETTERVHESISTSQQGMDISEKNVLVFSQLNDHVLKMHEMMREITAASREQSLGIDQIKEAVVDMDKVTQSNAAVSEEVAAAAEELNAQMIALHEVIAQLGSTHKQTHPATPSSIATPIGKSPASDHFTTRRRHSDSVHETR